MRCGVLFLLVLFCVGCVGTERNRLSVNVYHLKTIDREHTEHRLVRAEKEKYLRGAVERSERLSRRGLYYTFVWKLEKGQVAEKIVFLYKQAASGNTVLRKEIVLDSKERKGKQDFRVIGDAYQQGGRILAWRAELYAGGELQASEQSFLWE